MNGYNSVTNAGAVEWACASRWSVWRPIGDGGRSWKRRPIPFAVVTQAHLQAQETAGAVSARYAAKLTLVRSLYRRGYSRQDILELFRFIDWVLALPEVLEQQLWTEMQQFEEEKRMRYVSSFERIAQKRGLEKGIGQGQTKLLNMLLRQRFGALPDWAQARLRQAERAQLEIWALRVLEAGSLEEVFEVGHEMPH